VWQSKRERLVHMDVVRGECIGRCAEFLEDREADIMALLMDIATYRAAQAEIGSTVRALRGAAREIATHRPLRQRSMTVFLPSNVILYFLCAVSAHSVALCGGDRVSGLLSRRVGRRPAARAAPPRSRAAAPQCEGQPAGVHARVRHESGYRGVHGTYANGRAVKKQIRPGQLFLFFGQGINPFIVGPS